MDNLVPKKASGTILIALISLAIFGCSSSTTSSIAPSAAGPTAPVTTTLNGELTVFIRRHAGAPPLEVDKPGALPVLARGSMNMEVHLNQPAFIYLVWLDSEGNIVPLYPWNTDSLEIKDFNQPLPPRRATKVVFSPLQLGGGWAFGPDAGTETIILLARRTALSGDVNLADLLSSPPKPEFESSTDFIRIRLPEPEKTSTSLDSNHRALAEFLQLLIQHFDLLEAVQFPHKP